MYWFLFGGAAVVLAVAISWSISIFQNDKRKAEIGSAMEILENVNEALEVLEKNKEEVAERMGKFEEETNKKVNEVAEEANAAREDASRAIEKSQSATEDASEAHNLATGVKEAVSKITEEVQEVIKAVNLNTAGVNGLTEDLAKLKVSAELREISDRIAALEQQVSSGASPATEVEKEAKVGDRPAEGSALTDEQIVGMKGAELAEYWRISPLDAIKRREGIIKDRLDVASKESPETAKVVEELRPAGEVQAEQAKAVEESTTESEASSSIEETLSQEEMDALWEVLVRKTSKSSVWMKLEPEA